MSAAVMTSWRAAEASPRVKARTAAVLYLLEGSLAVFQQVTTGHHRRIRHLWRRRGDRDQCPTVSWASETLLRLWLAAALLAVACHIAQRCSSTTCSNRWAAASPSWWRPPASWGAPCRRFAALFQLAPLLVLGATARFSPADDRLGICMLFWQRGRYCQHLVAANRTSSCGPLPCLAPQLPVIMRRTTRLIEGWPRGRRSMRAEVLVLRTARVQAQGGLYTYLVPDQLAADAAPGQLVAFPLGRRSAAGIIWALDAGEDAVGDGEHDLLSRADDGAHLRPIRAILLPLPLLPPAQRALAEWLADHYASPLSAVARLFLPAGLARGIRSVLRPSQEASAETPAT